MDTHSENLTQSMSLSSQKGGLVTKFANISFLLFSLFIPWKFSSMVLPSSPGMFQESSWAWALNVWPNSAFMVLASLMLFFQILSYGFPSLKSYAGRYIMGFALLVLLSLLGLINSSSYAHGVQFCIYMLALLCYYFASYIYINGSKNGQKSLLSVWGVGILLTVLVAWQQYIWGFDMMAEFLAEQQAAGQEVSGILLAKYSDRRTAAPFDLPNSLAGFLMLGVPILLISAREFAKRFEPVKTSKIVLVATMALLTLGVFITTRSRAAILALLMTLFLYGVFRLKSLKMRILVVTMTLILVAVGGYYVVNSGRGVDSMMIRFDYAKVATKMALSAPITGDGWGDFRYAFMTQAAKSSEEVPQSAHNMVLDFASQSGVFAGVLIALLLSYPIIFTLVKRKFDWKNILLALGLLGFAIHSMADVNLQVPASMALLGVVSIVLLNQPSESSPSKRWLAVAVLPIIGVMVWSFMGDYWFNQLSLVRPNQLMAQSKILGRLDSYMPYSMYPHTMAASRYLQAGRFELAQQELLKARELAPLDTNPWELQLELDLAQNNLTSATQSVAKLQEMFPNNEIYRGTPVEVYQQLQKSRGF